MKRIFISLMIITMFFCLSSCDAGYQTRTAEFYGNIDKTSFWFKGEVVEEGYGYVYAQAVDADSVTVIEDHDTDSLDKYIIYDGTYLHSLRLEEKKYDTLKTDKGVTFLFDRNYKDFNKAKDIVDSVDFDGKILYCEVFKLADEKGKEIGESKYYFNGSTLYAIEWIEDGQTFMTLYMSEYSNTVPDDVYVSIPEDFKGGTYTDEQLIDLSR